MKINSTITLKPTIFHSIDPIKGDKLLRRMLSESKKRQKLGLKANKTVDCTKKTKFSSSASRKLSIPTPVASAQLSKSRMNEMDRSEVYRILNTWQQRVRIAEWLKVHNWVDDYSKAREELGYVDFQQYLNILRSKKMPSFPKIITVRIPLAKSDDNFCKLEWFGSKIFLKDFGLWNKRVTIEFEIPGKLFNLHSNFIKVTRPVIRLNKRDEVVFDFTFLEDVAKEEVNEDSVVSFDFGMIKPFSGSRVYENGKYSEEFIPSIHTIRHLKTVKIMDKELKFVIAKNKRREKLGIVNQSAVDQESTLRIKKHNTQESLDWSTARDMINHSKSGEAIVIEDLKWSGGGPVKFRHSTISMKLDHIASREGKKIKRVNAAYSSQECPVCETRVKPNSAREIVCDCGWKEDRDYTASIILGKRGSRKKPSIILRKDKPTPKRPRKKPRVHFLKKENTVRTTYTGVAPARATSDKIITATLASPTGFTASYPYIG